MLGIERSQKASGMRIVLVAVLLIVATCIGGNVSAQDLKSWKDGAVKQSIIDFVAAVTDRDSPSYVPVQDRIAVFDNDGTLWCEQPYYFQLAFAFDRVKAMADEHPQWQQDPVMKAALSGDVKTIAEGGEEAVVKVVTESHAGMTTEQFDAIVSDWIASAKHPVTGRRYQDMVYQPMVELLDYLRKHDFQTWIVSGGGMEFMRPWATQRYGVPTNQIIGSTIELRYQLQDGVPQLLRLPKLAFIDDKEGKPVAIHRHIGRRPIAAFGNSDGDLQMLQWTAAGSGKRLAVYIHHTDAEREYAYDRKGHIGRLDKGLDEAAQRDWTVVDMKQDWLTVFPTLQVK